MDGPRKPTFAPQLNKASAADYSSSDSESSDDYLRPGINPDDDGFGEFRPRKRPKLGGNSKEKAALGVFGSDSEDDGPGKKWKQKTLRNKGMSFVSKTEEPKKADSDSEMEDRPMLGNRTAGETADEDEDEDESEMDEEEDTGRGGVGLGFTGTPGGLGWTNNQSDKNPSRSLKSPAPSFVQSNRGGRGSGLFGQAFTPSSASEPVLTESAIRAASPPRNKPQPSAFNPKGKINEKSFGARMMAKMGYVEGAGLGSEGQGRNIIIEANLRPQGVGLGAVKEKSEHERKEEKRQAGLRGEVVEDSEEEARKEKKKRKQKGKKSLGDQFDSAGSTPRRQKAKYLTAAELKATAPGLVIPEAFAPILDMTGSERRMLTSTSGIMTPTSGVTESVVAIETRKVVKRAQADLLAFSEEWKSLEERKKWVELELNERERELEDLQADFTRLQTFSALVSSDLASATEWDQVIACLTKALDLGTAGEEVADLAVAAVHPLLRDPEWDISTEPSKFAVDLKPLAHLFLQSGGTTKAVGAREANGLHANDVYRRHHKATTPYETMMYKIWLPKALASVRAWDPFDPTPMLEIIDAWADLLPPFVRAQFMDNIARRLDATLSDWNPKKKRASHHLPHTWVFPWLQHLPPYHLDPKGTGLVAEVRRKFRQLINVWEYERGPVPGLNQWQEILGDQWRPLVMSHILPSMGRYLRDNFRVDPADQEPYLPILTGCLRWNGLLGETVVAELVAQSVMPMWFERLQEWLTLEEANLAEVADWYAWWRAVLLKDYNEVGGVGAEFDKGLQLMNLI